MGYRAEKLKVETKVRKVKWILLSILTVIILAACIFSAIVPPSTWQYYFSTPDIEERADGELRMHFLDVGQGDCSLIEFPNGEVMMIDGGNGSEETSKKILRYLNALDIDFIDYLVVTHADSDHCGSLDTVLEYKEVGIAYLPPVIATYTNNEYSSFFATLTEQGCKTMFSSRQIILSDEGAYPFTMAFLYPYSLDVTEEAIQKGKSEDNNAMSSVIWLDYNGASALFMGDAPKETEAKLMVDDSLGAFDSRKVDLSSTEILKVAHHGSDSSSSLEFLQYLNVKAAVISCGENNLYGHPTQNVLDNLAAVGAGVYRTDKLGNVMITVDKYGECKQKIVP